LATASADDGNVAANALDGSLATRWSASGDGQWIRFDLGSSSSVGSIQIAWYKGDLRRARFDVQTSSDAASWTTVFSGQSSGTSTTLETYDVTDSTGRYVRIVGHGTSIDLWNSICEVKVYGLGAVVAPGGLRLNISRPSSSMVNLNWNGATGAVSQVQVSSNLVNWVNVGSIITNTGASQAWQENISGLPTSARSPRFYRIKQTTVSQPTNTTLPTIGKTYAKVPMSSKKMACYINRPVDQYDPRVTRAVIVIHGAGANASGYFDRINNIIPSSLSDKVMVIAPYFQGDGTTVPSGEWGWPNDDWREGGASGGISSFTVLDNFVALLRNGNFPNLKWVVVTGHSAGGQTTQRYAAFTDADEKPLPNAQYMKFVVANPSSYFYLNQYRNPEGDSTWIVPSQDCTDGNGYNEWKYGLDGLYGYTAARGADWARAHMQSRQVELLAGTADTYDNGDLDLDCAAMWQGPHRYARAHIFKMFMDKYYPLNHLSITDVPGVDHDSTLMFSSSQGVNAIFFAD
jgi:pimeloyl-ACP methyl ester carboxylesterase